MDSFNPCNILDTIAPSEMRKLGSLLWVPHWGQTLSPGSLEGSWFQPAHGAVRYLEPGLVSQLAGVGQPRAVAAAGLITQPQAVGA